MGTINLGARIAARRKELRVTQEELANFLGVSKPAVSKWESGQSYPDILLLPELAAYFNISIDELIGYEPQMPKEEIRKLYRRLADEFVKEPFDKVYAECEEYLRKYYSCWQLQSQLGLLLINHVSLQSNQEKAKEIIKEVLEVFKRIARSSEDVNLAKQAVNLQALCYLSLNQPIDAIDLLEDMKESHINNETLLVKAYQQKGDRDKAIEHLQGYVYTNLMSILAAAPDFYQMYADSPGKVEQFYNIYMRLGEIFNIEKLFPAMLFQCSLMAAFAFAAQGDKDKALTALEHSNKMLEKLGRGKIVLKGNEIFDMIEKYFKDIDVEAEAPRNSEAIIHDFKNIITGPTFESLKKEERYQRILNGLSNK